VVITASVFAVLIVVAALSPNKDEHRVAAASANHTRAAPQADSSSSSADAVQLAPSTTEAPTTTTTEPPPPTAEDPWAVNRQDMKHWALDNADRAFALSHTMYAISTDASNLDMTSLAADCRELSTEVEDAQTGLPVPDPSVNEHYSKALDYFASAADECVQGATQSDSAALDESSVDILLGAQELGQATEVINSYQTRTS
jgi:hypothetical protein